MTSRYYVEQQIAGDAAELIDQEAHHLLHVMRGKSGDEVTLFDGQGAEYTARIVETTRAKVRLAIVARREIDRELHFSLIVAAALPKGDRQRWLIEKLVELGVQRFVPLQTSRGVAQPTGNALDRLRRAVIESAKQCGRNRLMQIDEPCAWSEFVPQGDTSAARWMAHPQATTSIAQCLSPPPATEFILAIGPEGGFTEDEVTQATSANWTAIDLGSRILRVETAALFLTSLAIAAAARHG